MCAIAGWAAKAEAAPPPGVLQAMAQAMAHRGPDGEGYHHCRTADQAFGLALGHRRLSIIDLATGDQPMHDAERRVSIVFNGEIYNFAELRRELEAAGHVFRTRSDTEVLVHGWKAWGEAMLGRLCGMFAFALWDAAREQLFLARDRFGKKPLFLLQDRDRLLFASEIKGLLAVPGVAAEIDRGAVADYLQYRYVPGPMTLLRGIRKLQPGTCALWQAGRLKVDRYYRPPDLDARPPSDLPADPVAAFLAALDDAVRIRMVSDVPYGAFLSGGIDSSAVVALMSRHSARPVKTFSVGFAERAMSELPHARAVADLCRTEHHELVVQPDDLMRELPRLIRYRDAPIAEPSDIPIYQLSRAASAQVKMVLTGEGSDEILAGYPKHAFEPHVATYQRLAGGFVRRRLIEPLVDALPYRFHRAKTAIASMGLADPHDRYPRWFGALARPEVSRLLALPQAGLEVDPLPFSAGADASPLRRILGFDQTSWLPDNLLERGDRMTMAASIEARMPFLDHGLVAFVSRLPDRFRLQGLTGKRILRQAMRRLLPASILHRPKVGFRVPVNDWFRGSMRDYLYDHLTGPGALTRAYYHLPALQQVLAEHVGGRQNHEKLLWTMLTLELFHRECLRPPEVTALAAAGVSNG